jgi:Acyltransferase
VARDRFRTPYPRPALMRVLGWVTDRLVLPRVARVLDIHVSDEDTTRLRAALAVPFVLCPNHPEYFTDWMLDKWLTGRFAPQAASWADPAVVNGMGRMMSWLWLSNGLVAAVRGEELEKALAYSGQCLARGDGALIHPEGEVNWDNESLGTMRAGAIRIAEHGAALAGRKAHVVPLTWFIRFREDATPGLQAELDYVESRLGVHAPRLAGPAQRLGFLYETLLEREAQVFGIELGPREDGFARRFEHGLAQALRRLWDAWPEYRPATLPATSEAAARAWRSAARKHADPAPEFRRQIVVLDKMLRLVPAAVGEPTVTQEQVSERIKRLRLDWLRGTTRDSVTRFVPRAAARRDVFVRVCEPLVVGAQSDHDQLLATLRERMLTALALARQDGLDALGPTVRYANPFLA